MKRIVWFRQHPALRAFLTVVGLCGMTALAACDENEEDNDGESRETPSADAATADASPAPTPSDASTQDAASADAGSADAAAKDASAPSTPLMAAAGTCSFTVDGTAYQTVVDDLSTLALYYPDKGDITVQCGVREGGIVRSVNLAITATKGAGTYNTTALQYNEQSDTGSSLTQWRKFSGDVAVTSASNINVAGSFTASLGGTDGTTKQVSFAFNLTPVIK